MRTLQATWPAVFTLIIVASLFRARPLALAAEPATTAQAPDRVISIRLPKALPAATLDVEVLAALRYWTARPTAELRPWARAIVGATRSRAEAIELASVAAVESRMLPWVIDGRCNRGSWRLGQHGWVRESCDGGWAVGPWQLHDQKMLGASPDAQAREAATWYRAAPERWTTWRVAKAQVKAWLAIMTPTPHGQRMTRRLTPHL